MVRIPATPVTDEVIEKVTAIVRETLDERFSRDEFTFDPILVKEDIDHYGDEFIDITIIYEGDRKYLDPSWTARLVGRILPKMESEGIYVTRWPHKRFISRRGWEELQAMDPYDELG